MRRRAPGGTARRPARTSGEIPGPQAPAGGGALRSLWKGTISFGLVTIPVKLYAATEDKGVKFHYLHAPCRTPVRYVKWCPACHREVPMEEIVRGYEYEPGRYVILAEEDLADLPVPMARTVEILDFVRLADIDPIYYLRTYFIEPGDGGGKAYALLRRALLDTGRVALARVALRGKSSLATVRVYQGRCLALETMHFPDEVRSYAGLALPDDAGYREQELEMARMLIETMAGEFLPEKFRDEYREALLARIREKIAGEHVVAVEAPAPTARVVDLMEALRESLRLAEAARARAAAGAGGAEAEAPAAGAAPSGAAVPPGAGRSPGFPPGAIPAPGPAAPAGAVPWPWDSRRPPGGH